MYRKREGTHKADDHRQLNEAEITSNALQKMRFSFSLLMQRRQFNLMFKSEVVACGVVTDTFPDLEPKRASSFLAF